MKIRLTESKLKQIVEESVKKILKENVNPNHFVIVDAWDDINGNTYSELVENFADAIITSKYDGDVFLLPKNIVFSFPGDMPNIEIYNIPNTIRTINELEENLVNGDISLENLERMD